MTLPVLRGAVDQQLTQVRKEVEASTLSPVWKSLIRHTIGHLELVIVSACEVERASVPTNEPLRSSSPTPAGDVERRPLDSQETTVIRNFRDVTPRDAA